MKTIEHQPNPEHISWYKHLLEAEIPVTAVQTYSYVVTDEDLNAFVEKTYKTEEQRQFFWDALGVNTRSMAGVYVQDVDNALKRLKGIPTWWD